MKTIKILSLFLVLSFLMTSCYKNNGWGVRGKGEVVSEVRPVTGCDRLNLSIDADVDYKQDSIYYLEVFAQPNILSLLKTEVHGTELSLEYKRNIWDHKQVRVVLHTPDMRAIRISGSGNVQGGRIQTSTLDLTISGSGNINLSNVLCTGMSGNISGSGNIHLDNGKIQNQTLTISGSGNIHSENCESSSNATNISGSGSVLVYVTESLKVKISGSGDVKYRGKPTVSVDISGSGSLIQIP